MMKVHVNGRETTLGGRYVGADLRDSTDIADDPAALRSRLDEDGFVLVRSLLGRDAVFEARRSVFEPLLDDGVIDPAAPLLDGAIRTDPPRISVDWRNPEVRTLTTAPELHTLFERLLGGDVVTYDYKWLRVVGRDYHTGLHWDSIYWETGEVYSCWIPLGDIPIEQGPLAVLCNAPQFVEEARQAPRELRKAFEFWSTIDHPCEIMDRTGGRLETTDFQAGDVVVFTMFTPHCTLKNQTDRLRASVDVRYQLASEPVDAQYMGENPSHVDVVRSTAGALAGRTDLVGRQG